MTNRKLTDSWTGRIMRLMGSNKPTAAALECIGAFWPADLTFLLHAAVDRMVEDLDQAAADIGLNDARDWLVLAALTEDAQRTQLELSRMICIDKTTLITVLDRLEQRGLIVRTVDPTDRRVRIPRLTPRGQQVRAKFATARDAVDPEQRTLLLQLLARIADRSPVPAAI
jgi:DNA-binding MarR family transcriptional regulator